jgi:phenylacetate-CoA ligase
MHDALLKRYHRLPPFLRSIAASARGGYLRAWRYGPRTDPLCDAALAREHWTPADWRNWQEERLALLLYRAATRVPYYREHWAKRRRQGDKAPLEVLGNWPLLDKEAVRKNPRAFVADDRSVTRMFHDHTSGTSGKSLDLWLSRDTVQSWYALFEARCRRWNGVSRHDRWAIIGGQLIAAVEHDAPPFWVWNAPLHQLYLSAYHLAPRHIKSYADALRGYRIQYLVGYPSAIHTIAREMLDQRIPAPPLKLVLTNAEPLLERQRAEIGEAFRCPVRETYGMAEIVAAASECEHGSMHLWPEAGVLETIQGTRENENRPSGEFVCTGLLNADMPLIRYRVGDHGELAAEGGSCECGRTLPVLAAVDGRADDILYTVDGRAVGRLDPVFKSRLPIHEAQIVQEALDRIRVRYVPADGFTGADGESLAARIRERMGPINVVLDQVAAIPRTANGKFRAVICQLSAEEKGKLRR